jgi:hypothetical protein
MTLYCSLNEIDALVRKAARGSGLTWGLAEEAGKATRWLAARRLPSVTVVAGLLEQNDGLPYEALCPQIENGAWRAKRGRLCPLITGAALNDRVEAIAGGQDICLAVVSYPILLLPFLGRACEVTGQAIDLGWDDVRMRVLPEGSHIEGNGRDLGAAGATQVTVRAASQGASESVSSARTDGIEVDPAVWSLLNQFAIRTYVPASEESRMRGAGAGDSDVD